jgi:hypothetical protein
MIVLQTMFIALAFILPLQIPAEQREQTACEVRNGGLGSKDFDRDGIENCEDNCVLDANSKQSDRNRNGIGDACEWRERQDRKWEGSGRELRRQAREPVDLSTLIAKSSDVVVGQLNGFSWVEKDGGVAEVEVSQRLKDSTDPSQQQYVRPMWVFVPRRGPLELVGQLLLFLKNDRAREWRKPALWPEPLRPGAAPEGQKYFRYNLADLRFGVLGVSSQRLIEIQKIVAAQGFRRQPSKRVRRTGVGRRLINKSPQLRASR